MFEQLASLPADPLLGLIEKYRNDQNPRKVDLGVGIYKNEQGLTPVLSSVKAAETALLATEDSKAYVGPSGNVRFNEAMKALTFGASLPAIEGRVAGFQTPGGCGALRVLAETIVSAKPAAKIWVSDPTWVNHMPLLGSAGIELSTYPYYDFDNSSLNFEAMIAALNGADAGDIVLLHGCCHNPCGADLSETQWEDVIDLCARKGLIPFIDMAYQGFGENLDSDAFGVRLAAAKLPELIVAVSCSKNFGLYRERVGAAFVVAQNAEEAAIVDSHMKSITRGIYSMPPSHGASIVAHILEQDALATQWQAELTDMRTRIKSMRAGLSSGLNGALGQDSFSFVERERGMFSFLGLSPSQVAVLAAKYSIYMADSSRINVAGLTTANLDYCVSSIASVYSGEA